MEKGAHTVICFLCYFLSSMRHWLLILPLIVSVSPLIVTPPRPIPVAPQNLRDYPSQQRTTISIRRYHFRLSYVHWESRYVFKSRTGTLILLLPLAKNLHFPIANRWIQRYKKELSLSCSFMKISKYWYVVVTAKRMPVPDPIALMKSAATLIAPMHSPPTAAAG